MIIHIFSFHIFLVISCHLEMKFMCLTLLIISEIMDIRSDNDLFLLKSCVLKR